MSEDSSSDGNDIKKRPIDPTTLKVPPSGGKSFSKIQHDIDRVIEKNAGRFMQFLADDLKAIEAMLKVYMKEPTRTNMRPIFDRVHNLRGQGTLFNYPLVTIFGGHFCRYINNLPENTPPRRDVVVSFIHSLKLVQANKIQGAGSKTLQELALNMKLMTDKLINS
ncbi:MAG: hypothetical protein HRT36_05025 [Alphaproteobacteria bacterium]|nr:hypothetical protein [Alphaproteobacteria bacterium]